MALDLTIESSLLHYALSTSGSVTPKRSTMPVLLNVLLKAENGKVQISGSNAEIAVNVWVTAEVKSEGEITVPECLLGDVVSRLEHGKEVHLYEKNMTLFVDCGPVNAQMRGISAEEFPVTVVNKLGTGSMLSVAAFKALINQVGVAAAASPEKAPILQGIHFNMTGTAVTASATDQFRVAVGSIPVNKGYPSEFTVPAAALDKVAKNIGSTVSPEIEVHVLGDSKVVWNVPGKMQIVSQLLAGKYPDVQRAFPQTTPATVVTVDRRAMKAAADLIKLFAQNGNGMATLKVAGGKMVYSAVSEEMGASDYEIVPDEISGQDCAIGISAQFMFEAIDNVSADKLRIALNGPGKPIVVSGSGEEKISHLLMPMVQN